MNPGDTRGGRSPRCRCSSLNEGRDVNPGDTRTGIACRSSFRTAQRRPGRESRRHDSFAQAVSFALHAQRRPGRESRRHLNSALDGSAPTTPLNEGRDVNPGDTSSRPTAGRRGTPLNEGRDVNPGDTWASSHVLDGVTAQRRPGRESRRHSSTFAQPAPNASSLNEGRDVNPGDTRKRCSSAPCRSTLNEGRDVNPGDTSARLAAMRSSRRSTKAGT